MTKLPGAGGSLFTIALASLALAGCAGEGTGEGPPPAPPPIGEPPAPGAHAVVGTYVMHIQPRKNTMELYPLRGPVAPSGPQVGTQGLTNASIVADGMASSGPNYTVELNTTSTTDTFTGGATASCPAGAFCGDVTFTHFFPGLNLSAVYAQITGIADSGGNLLTNHNALNGVGSTPFGLDLKYGAWSYTGSLATMAYGAGATQTWAFTNPDDSDFYVYLRVYAALYPMMWFDTTGITQTAPLIPGQPAIVHYMYAKNGGCRGSNWAMQGYLKGFNIDKHTTSYVGLATDTYFDQQVILPFGPGLDFWFDNTDSGGCLSKDDNSGNRYNYSMAAASPAIHFAGPNAAAPPYYTGNWNVSNDSGVKAGSTITVDYEVNRAACIKVDRYGRVPSASSLTMWYRYDTKGGSYTPVNMLGLPYDVPSSINGVSGQVFVPPSIALASGHSTLWVYFEYDDGAGCHNYDSSNGSNYSFPI